MQEQQQQQPWEKYLYICVYAWTKMAYVLYIHI